MEKYILRFLSLVAVVAILQSCTNSKYPGYKESETGVYYKFHEESSDTNHPKLTDYVSINMKYGLLDTVLFDSKGFDTELQFPLIESMFKGDLFEALKLMSPGDSMSFVIVADSFYLKTINMSEIPDFVTAGELIYYDIRLAEIQTVKERQKDLKKIHGQKHKEEISNLLAYIRENKIETAPTASGFYYIESKKGKGPKADTGDICSVYLTVTELNGTQLFTNFNGEPLGIEFGKEFDTEGFMLGLAMMRKGGKAKFIVPSSIGVGIYGTQGVDGFTTLIYEVELKDITPYAVIAKRNKEEEKRRNTEREKLTKEEYNLLSNYIKNNSIQVKPHSSGMYYIESVKGRGDKAKLGNTVEVHYKLYNIKGEVLDSSLDRGQTFTFQLGAGEVIEGWELGIQMMNKGAKSTFIIPSNLAYGKQGYDSLIPPNTTLVFDIELISIY
jgi:FKBP-type peptidyl-prolyl cis-trans isomerase